STRLALLCAGALFSCDRGAPVDETESALSVEDPASDVDLIRTLRSIEVSPNNSVLPVDLSKKGTRNFKVVARYNDRSTADVTASATFTVDNPSVGTMTGATFESSVRTSSQVDFVQIIARYRESGVEATAHANLTVAWLRASGPSPDLVFTLPYMGST